MMEKTTVHGYADYPATISPVTNMESIYLPTRLNVMLLLYCRITCGAHLKLAE